MELPKMTRGVFAEDLDLVMVDLYVASNGIEKQFKVHKKLICTKIKFFDELFNTELHLNYDSKGVYREPNTLLATFSAVDPGAFRHLISWVYSGTIMIPTPLIAATGDLQVLTAARECQAITPGDAQAQQPASKLLKSAFIIELLKLYNLAEKYEITDILNPTMDAIFDIGMENWEPPEHPDTTIKDLYEQSSATSPIRLFIARSLLRCFRSKTDSNKKDFRVLARTLHASLDLTTDLLTQIAAHQSLLERPLRNNRCDYHVHGEKSCAHAGRETAKSPAIKFDTEFPLWASDAPEAVKRAFPQPTNPSQPSKRGRGSSRGNNRGGYVG